MSQPPRQEGTLQPYPYPSAYGGQSASSGPPPKAPSRLPPEITALVDAITALIARLVNIPGVVRYDNYLYDERGITAQNKTLNIDVVQRLSRPATSGYIIADSATIKIDFNKKSSPITLNTGETFTLHAEDSFAITNLYITSASATAGVRIFLN